MKVRCLVMNRIEVKKDSLMFRSQREVFIIINDITYGNTLLCYFFITLIYSIMVHRYLSIMSFYIYKSIWELFLLRKVSETDTFYFSFILFGPFIASLYTFTTSVLFDGSLYFSFNYLGFFPLLPKPLPL